MVENALFFHPTAHIVDKTGISDVLQPVSHQHRSPRIITGMEMDKCMVRLRSVCQPLLRGLGKYHRIDPVIFGYGKAHIVEDAQNGFPFEQLTVLRQITGIK